MNDGALVVVALKKDLREHNPFQARHPPGHTELSQEAAFQMQLLCFAEQWFKRPILTCIVK